MPKKTDTELAPEPLGWIPSAGGDIIVYECAKCLSVVTSLSGHIQNRPECG